MSRKAATAHIASWARENLPPADREQFREIAETELLSLHDGNYARHRIRPAEFAAWQEVWAGSPASIAIEIDQPPENN